MLEPRRTIPQTYDRVALGVSTFLLAILGEQLRRMLCPLIALLLAIGSSQAETVLFVSRPEGFGPVKAQVDTASHFYGLDLRHVMVGAPKEGQAVTDLLKRPELLVALISGNVLTDLDPGEVFAALRRPGHDSVPLAIVDISPADSGSLIARWTQGSVAGCQMTGVPSDGGTLSFSTDREFSAQLAGIELPFENKLKCGLVVGTKSSARIVEYLTNSSGRFPVLVTSWAARQRVFVLAGLSQQADSAPAPSGDGMSRTFSEIASIMLVLRQIAGEYAWHSPSHFANLTVDDAWLVEPYGNLDYDRLLAEMDAHNFHTTIAFIPWNFDRSRSGVVSLFRNHPERFSVCVHGNNHDHREFGDYSRVPLSEQVKNIKQGLARMERFTALTGIPYSPVMVFPHAVAPLGTFEALKKYNYWATANSQNVPLGSLAPEDPLFSLRSQTLAFGNFLSLRRYSAELPFSQATVAVNAYLGNPLLFYVHQEFFHGDIGAFDRVADAVNKIESATEWKSLGDIARHLYLLRKRGSGSYDVLTFSPDFYLTNPDIQEVTFHVQKPENFLPDVQAVNRDGESLSYARAIGGLSFELVVAGGQSAHLQVRYANDLDLPQISVSKTGNRLRTLRWLSDVRDLWLTKSSLGLKLSNAYYGSHLDELELSIERWGPTALIILLVGALTYRLHYLGKGVCLASRRAPAGKPHVPKKESS